MRVEEILKKQRQGMLRGAGRAAEIEKTKNKEGRQDIKNRLQPISQVAAMSNQQFLKAAGFQCAFAPAQGNLP